MKLHRYAIRFYSKRPGVLLAVITFTVIGSIFVIRSFADNPNLNGDINNDNIVNISDLSILLTAYGKSTNPAADINEDGQVGITDLSMLLSNFGKTYAGNPTPNPPGPTPNPPGPTPNPPSPNPSPPGRLIWSDAPASPVGKSHPLENWENASWNFAGGATATVVSDPVKGKAIRFFGPANGTNGSFQRGELVPTYDNIKPGEQLWLAYDLWVDSPLGLARAHQQLWQIKSAPSEGSPTFAVNINNHREGLVTGNNGTLFAPTPYNKWVRLIFGFNVTTGSSSWMEIWQDGVNVQPRYSTGALYRSGDSKVYLKIGVYRAAPKPYDITMRMANFKLGTTKEIVQ